MKMTRWLISTAKPAAVLPGLFLVAALAGCGGSAVTGDGTTAVTVTIGGSGSSAAPSTVSSRATPRPLAATIPPTVTALRFTIRAAGFADIVQTVPVTGATMTVTLQVPDGPGRTILVEALDSVGGAAGNYVYKIATKQIQSEVSTGTNLTVAMQNVNVFPNMMIQMVSIGEESGQLDAMLSKVADFFEAEVDDSVEAMSSLMEPLIMVVLGTLIGGMVVAMYLPIFKLGQIV